MATSDEERREVEARLMVAQPIINVRVGATIGETAAGRINRPTCEMRGNPGAQYGVCTRCGAFVRRDAVTDCTRVIPVKFCPNCSAEVI